MTRCEKCRYRHTCRNKIPEFCLEYEMHNEYRKEIQDELDKLYNFVVMHQVKVQENIDKILKDIDVEYLPITKGMNWRENEVSTKFML